MGNMIPVCTERNHSCAHNREKKTQDKNVNIVFHADDYYCKRKKRKKKKRKRKNNIN